MILQMVTNIQHQELTQLLQKDLTETVIIAGDGGISPPTVMTDQIHQCRSSSIGINRGIGISRKILGKDPLREIVTGIITEIMNVTVTEVVSEIETKTAQEVGTETRIVHKTNLTMSRLIVTEKKAQLSGININSQHDIRGGEGQRVVIPL